MFSSPKLPYLLRGPPASYSRGKGVLFWGENWFGFGVNHPPPSTAEVKNEWIQTSSHLMCTHVTTSENLTLYLL